MTDNLVTAALKTRLAVKRVELIAATQRVQADIREAHEAKVSPAKDYWHNKVRLQNEVDALEKLVKL